MKEKNANESLKDVVVPLVKMPLTKDALYIRDRCRKLANEILSRERDARNMR
jgi:hypothetical protein